MDDEVLNLDAVHDLALQVLTAHGLAAAQAEAIARTIAAAEADECRSHGLYRLIGYAGSLRSGRVNARAEPKVTRVAGSVIRVDAQHGFASLANEIGRPALIEVAKRQGMAALVIDDCYHFSALWSDIEPLAEAGLVCWAYTIGQCCVAPAGGTLPLFGTNPIAFGWPRPDKPAFIVDFATSAAARGEVELRRRAGETLPAGWAIGPDGAPTTDPEQAIAGALLPFGSHKGSALSMMVELIAGPLISGLTSRQAARLDNGDGGPPLGGELIIALNLKAFALDDAVDQAGEAEMIFAQAKQQEGVRLPSERRYEARKRTRTQGVRVPERLLRELRALL
jgi:LDH2 family malate/lactate/ureidoglycolate dehydrogenase